MSGEVNRNVVAWKRLQKSRPSAELQILGFDQGDLGRQLHVDHHLDSPFELKKENCVFGRQHAPEFRNVLQSQLRHRFVHSDPPLHERVGLAIAHRRVGLQVLLNQRVFRVVDLYQVGSVGVIDRPEFLRFRVREFHIGRDELLLFGTNVLAEHCDLIVGRRLKVCRWFHGCLTGIRLRACWNSA